MTQNNKEGLRRIRRALISVSDKTGIVDLARTLETFNVEIISTGGTAVVLREQGIQVRDISEVTGFPEMMDGRVKTLHPRVHGGLLALRDNEAHLQAMQAQGIEPIDMVVVNLYPFERTVASAGVSLDEAIEQIDIGGPAMIRSAAKNWRDVAVVVSPDSYPFIIDEMNAQDGALRLSTRASLVQQAFERTSSYDDTISAYLSTVLEAPSRFEITREDWNRFPWLKKTDQSSSLPGYSRWRLRKIRDLRYGENPHQAAALYDSGESGGIANARLLWGKEMSFNNYVDADAAWNLVNDLAAPACAIIKHTNAAGVGMDANVATAYRKALATDPISAFGGIVAFNRKVDQEAALAVIEIFTEVVIAPDYDADALETLQTRKNVRVLKANQATANGLAVRQISGGMLAQTPDTVTLKREDLKAVTKRPPTEEEVQALLFAWTVCKHTKSNAIVYANGDQTVGVGAGQMSRVDSVKIGAMRARLPVKGSVMASDAFFPFRDGIDEAARHGVTAVIQPGGSVRDSEVIAAADEHNLAMVFTGVRHFRH
jgi:phosphoribosylaminoimidazolecarboxamide formyltransferase / IMP cyclohydrolase